MVIKQNLKAILKPRAELYDLDRANYDTERDFEVALLSKFNKEAIEAFIEETNQSEPLLSDEIINILSVFYIMKKINTYGEKKYEIAFADKNKIIVEEKEKWMKAVEFVAGVSAYAKSDGYDHITKFITLFEGLIRSIEISSDNGKEVSLQYVYFPNHPIFNQLSSDTRDDIMFRVKRGTQRDKLISLLEMKEEVAKEVNLNFTLQYKPHDFPFRPEGISFEITSDYALKVRGLARKISFLICFLMVSFVLVDHDTEEGVSTFDYTSDFTEFIMKSLAGLQMLVTFWFLVVWWKLRKPLCLAKYDHDLEEALKKAAKERVGKSEEKQKKKEH